MFKNLIVWQKSYQLCLEIHQILAAIPLRERFELTSQMKRAAISIVSNIAEGARRKTKRDFNYFLSLSQGSCAELETQIMLARDLKYFSETSSLELINLAHEISKILTKLIKNNSLM